jgi:CheY-like chemotaxis protein
MTERLHTIEVLLVEDDPGDVLLTKEAFADNKVKNNLNVVSNGEEAIAYLRRQGPHAEASRPDLVLLDLNLPKKDGCEVLAELKADSSLKVIPVVVLTTSAAESDVLRMYQLHANSYVTKPVGFDQFLSAIQHIEDFWLSLARLCDGVAPSP